ncbi:hypothetical protein EDD76_111110 [Kineothrix alysoides]|uniref:Uncharacterized protein n=1 Tax=Kineothrix alysoides TaxID=1469948 RepID=A0A4R1QRW4_9FIRM|nr:DUF6179 domain-containing protein [Kineothrix alysoides]TCL56616.1 hypothetical protein EDD76_111110 [Kineothrix alysoides]
MEYGIEELLPVVKYLTEKYTSKESTSITYEKAQQLMGAVLYCVEEREMHLQGGDGSEHTQIVESGARKSAMETYKEGFQLVMDKVSEAKIIYEEIMVGFDAYESRCCYDTVVRGMPAFFVHYDARFFPQNHMLTLDYPLLVNIPDEICGVDLIYSYLKAIRLEQRFLQAFPRNYIIEAQREYHRGYKELFLNVSSVVMRYIVRRMLEQEGEACKGSAEEIEHKMKALFHLFMEQEYRKREEKDFCVEAENYVQEDIHSFAVEYKNYVHV